MTFKREFIIIVDVTYISAKSKKYFSSIYTGFHKNNTKVNTPLYCYRIIQMLCRSNSIY